MASPSVELIGLTKRFGAVSAVSDVNLSVPEGKITTLLGPSGCGKTTLLRLIAGFVQADEGEVRINNRRVNEVPPQRRSTVVVFQDYALFPHLSVFENVAYGLRRRAVGRSEIRRRVTDMLAFLGLPDHDTRSPLLLSGGQQQRVALARALVVEPDVLLLDEPLSNLDVKLRVRVRSELKEIQQSLGKTTILVTHDQEEALSLSDQIAVMDAGRIRQSGVPQEIYARPADTFVADFVGIANFIPARIRDVNSNTIVLDSPFGQITTAGSGWLTGRTVKLLVRPMAIQLSMVPHEGYVKASVRSISFLGETTRYVLQVGELRVIADRPSSEYLPARDEVWLNILPTSGFHILPFEETT